MNRFLLVLIGLLTGYGWADGSMRGVTTFEDADAFARDVEKDQKRLIGESIRFSFKDKRIQQQVFRKVKGKERWQNHLFFSRMVSNEKAGANRGDMWIDGWIYEYQGARRPYQEFPQVTCRMPFVVQNVSDARRALRAADMLSLTIEVEGRIESIRKAKTDSYEVCLSDATVVMRDGNKEIFRGSARTAAATELPVAGVGVETGNTIFETTPVLEMEAENAPALKLYADWDRSNTGWYARELTHGCSGNAIATVHVKNVGASFDYELPEPLPPALYRVEVNPYYASARLTENIVEVTLADAMAPVAWFYGGKDKWMTSPTMQTAGPATKLSIKAVKVGGGGVNSAPEMHEMVIMLDRIRIVRVTEKAK